MNFLRPISVVAFARNILLRIKALSNASPAAFQKNPGEPSVSYRNDGRSGYVVYASVEGSFELYYEFGGGDAVAVITTPKTERWQAETGFPLEQREAILHFIGRETAARQTKSGSYSIEEYGLVIWE